MDQPLHTALEFADQRSAEDAAVTLAGGELIVMDKQTEIVEEPPPPPYDTATLLEDSATFLQWKAEKTMQIAQALFEGIELHDAHFGLITYHRTDSQRVAPEAQAVARMVITRLHGKEALPSMPILSLSDGGRVNLSPSPSRLVNLFQRFGLLRPSKSQPEPDTGESAHEAIRPTSPERLPDSLRANLDDDHLALYRLVWERFIASQMKGAKYRVTTVELESA